MHISRVLCLKTVVIFSRRKYADGTRVKRSGEGGVLQHNSCSLIVFLLLTRIANGTLAKKQHNHFSSSFHAISRHRP